MKNNIMWEIWGIMPPRFQGLIMGMLLITLIVITSDLLQLLQTDIWYVDLAVALCYIFGVLKVVVFIYPWLERRK